MPITRAAELDDALAAALPLQVLGQTARSGPLSRLVVLGRSDPRAGVAVAALLAGTLRTPAAIATKFPTARRGRDLYVLNADGAERFLVSPGLLGQIVISAGSWPFVLPVIGPKAEPIPIANKGELQADLDLFCAVADVAAGGVDLELRATGITVDRAFSALGQAGKAIVDRVRPKGPGQVYRPPVATDDEDAISFAHIGGQDEAKAELEMICLAVRDPAAFAAWGSRPPRGILLYGPPGTGKTMLARALAAEAGARFIHVRATDIVSKWYGEAERKLQQAFDWARNDRPAVMFFDELDAIARSRDYSHEATHRIVSTFLENLDGLEGIEGVIVLGATNRPEAVDEALTRPGRFDRLVEVPLPSAVGRRAIFEIHMSRAERKARRELFEEPSEPEWLALTEATQGFSGADIAEGVRRVLESRVRSGVTSGVISVHELLANVEGVRRPF
jgi:ATPase family associated with various cellular activities (AAA)